MPIFTHRAGTYLFDRADGEDWIAQHFFAGGVMPSHHLIRQYADLFSIEKEWRWSGTHYQRTAGNQGSGVLSSMVQANGLIVLHHGQGNVAVGDAVDVMVFEGVI